MKLKAVVLTAAMLLVPTAALAAPGIVTESAGLRAGPGPGFPLVDRIPGGARVNVHGCLRGDAWCDISWSGDRGWVSSAYLEYLYHNSYVYLPDYVDEVDVPIVPFVLGSYWSSYYAGRPWYHRRAYWNNYWTSHQRFATHMTPNRSAARIGREATRNATVGEGRTSRTGVAERGMRERNAAQFREGRGREMQGREATRMGNERMGRERMGRERTGEARMGREGLGREYGAGRANAHMQPSVRAHEGARFSAAPGGRPTQHMAQPTVGGRAAVNAHAQAPMPHAAAPAMHGGGGAPHMNAAPRGPAGGGGPGRERH